MTFDGSKYVALHDDLVEPDQPLDSFVEMGLRSNQIYINQAGHQISWTPRCWDADNMVAYTGHRPYASVAPSTLLYIPWLIQKGLSELHIQLEHRVSDEHDSGETVKCDVKLGPYRILGTVLSKVPGANYPWQPLDIEVPIPQPRAATSIAPLEVWQQGSMDTGSIESSTPFATFTWSLGGMLVTNDAGDLFSKATGTLPSATDQHVQAFVNREDVSKFDMLDTRDLGDLSYALVRPPDSYYAFTKDADTRSLGYVQVRSLQIDESFDLTGDTPDSSRFLPQRTVEGRDDVSHALSLSLTASRWRPLFIGPVGQRQGAELYPTGYGRKFEAVQGSATPQSFLVCPLSPRDRAPTIRLLAYVIGVWSDSGHEASILTPEQLREATGQAVWTLTMNIKRYEDGSATPVAMATKTLEQVMGAAPAAITQASTFLTQEAIFDGADLGLVTLPASYPYKEGQLFAEDLGLVELVDLAVELPTYDPSTNDMPLIFELEASASVTGVTFPPPEGATSVSVSTGDLRLVCVGYTIWERP